MKTKIITNILLLLTLTLSFTMYGYDSWDSDKVYSTAGTLVEHNGKVWKNSWWTRNESPDLSGQWGVWKFVENTVVEPTPPAEPIANNDTAISTVDTSVVIDVLADDTGDSLKIKSVGFSCKRNYCD